jgi:hypothetical protein
LGFAFTASAQMQSDNYRITTSVLSSGGGPTASDNFNNDATMGQSSPLMQGDQNPFSANYNSYPGFWYTIAAQPLDLCSCDLNQSGGSCNFFDWLIFIEDWGSCTEVGCSCDLNQDGSCNFFDWLVFIEDWGRTDCP